MFTKNEKGLIEWALRNEIRRCERIIENDQLAKVWIESHALRLDTAISALDKVVSVNITKPLHLTEES